MGLPDPNARETTLCAMSGAAGPLCGHRVPALANMPPAKAGEQTLLHTWGREGAETGRECPLAARRLRHPCGDVWRPRQHRWG